MNTLKHAQISVRRHGGIADDYFAIHQFIDSTKSLCSDNRHRIFHTLWAVNEIVLPIFGHTLINTDGNEVDVKDLCEKDHLLVDFHHRFIPTLDDFVMAMRFDLSYEEKQAIERFHSDYAHPQISRLLLSPLAITGQLKSLLITHNSWFINDILPRLGLGQPILQDFSLCANDIFEKMDFALWMDNGTDYPPSAEAIQRVRIEV